MINTIFLNTWGGRAGRDVFIEFIQRTSYTTDVFCFQEMWHANLSDELTSRLMKIDQTYDDHLVQHTLFSEVSACLPEFQGFFRPSYGQHFGLALFVRKNFSVQEEGDFFVFRERGFIPSPEMTNRHPRSVQYAHISTPTGIITILNVHGLWCPGKGDTPETLAQCTQIRDFIVHNPYPILMGGDFNLLPETQALALFRALGLRDLIQEYGITSTRTSLYHKEGKFSDYVFVSPELTITNFHVLPDPISDHCALEVVVERA